MNILGVDFTSRPTASKPITCARCTLDGDTLRLVAIERWPSFAGFESALAAPGPWVAGMDFPFGQSRRLVEGLGWPTTWAGYVERVAELEREQFRAVLEAYKAPRPPGDKHHKRRCDAITNSQSPQTLYGTPVGLMFYEGAPRLLRAGVHLPHSHDGDRGRIVLEAYPGVLARSLIGKASYKSDTASKQNAARQAARAELLTCLQDGECVRRHGFALDATLDIARDHGADELDALLCAIQAAWGVSQGGDGFGAPAGHDRLEGWICDPLLA